MQYPMHTNSKPAVGKEGKRILEAIKSNTPILSDEARATISTIVEQRKDQKGEASKRKIR